MNPQSPTSNSFSRLASLMLLLPLLLRAADYQKYFDVFNPDLYEPHQWAKLAKAAGMRYAVITAKHHEGFCLWDSRFTDFKAPNTPAGRDLLKEWVEAFRAEGLKVGFYYSLLDW